MTPDLVYNVWVHYKHLLPNWGDLQTHQALVCFKEQEPIGFITYIPLVEGITQIVALAVHPAECYKGVGTTLLQSVAKRFMVTHAWVSVRNPHLEWWLKRGKVVGQVVVNSHIYVIVEVKE